MKYLQILFFHLFASIALIAQSDCPLFNSASFTKQVQIDSFAIKYPNCKIINDFMLRDNDITNLDKFPKDIEINGSIDISNCANLESFHYELNFNFLTHYVKIQNNAKLKSISGLSSINKADNIIIRNNPLLSDSIFFPNLTECGNIDINDNETLSKIYGFDSLIKAKSIEIYRNGELKEIIGFNKAKDINGLEVYQNDKLLKFDGFNNYGDYVKTVHFDSRELSFFKGFQNIKSANLISFSNVNLEKINSFYDVESSQVYLLSCEYLKDIGNFKRLKRAETINVSNNKSLKDFSGFDSLRIIVNQLHISNNLQLNSINGFNQLDSIYGLFNLWGNDISEINGFNKVNYIKRLSITDNKKCTTFNGFNQLQKVEQLEIVGNNSMEKMDAFSNLVYCDSINFRLNQKIKSIGEFEKLEKDHLKKLVITNNNSLSLCNANPICEYMEDLSKFAIVSNNAPGCATRQEIINSCGLNGIEKAVTETIVIYPNPVSAKLSIKGKFDKGKIIDVNGQIISTFSGAEVDCHALNPGIYFVRLFQNESYKTYRFVKI